MSYARASSNYENTGNKRSCLRDVENIKNCRKQDFEDEANNVQLDKDENTGNKTTLPVLFKYGEYHCPCSER